jgi:hypothetical protein
MLGQDLHVRRPKTEKLAFFTKTVLTNMPRFLRKMKLIMFLRLIMMLLALVTMHLILPTAVFIAAIIYRH